MYLPRYLPRLLYLVTPFDDGVVALVKHRGGGARLDKWVWQRIPCFFSLAISTRCSA
jgi:hypothetical protein